MPYTVPSVSDFQNYFYRDFPFGNSDPNTSVLPLDVINALMTAGFNFNSDLFPSQETYTLAYLLLAAHYLVINLRSSSQGKNGQYNWLEQSKGVGAANVSYAIPQRILDNPYWSMLTKTNYGSQYLQLLLPQLTGAMFTVYGPTKP